MRKSIRTLLTLTSVLLGGVVFNGCASVQPWERDTLALEAMVLEDVACHQFERNIEVYREGAVGANGGKSGGGCGCT